MTDSKDRNVKVFNTPLEFALRSAFILAAASPHKFDLQRLIYYDYLVLHTNDIGGPLALHPAYPHRSAEILVKRQLIQQGLLILKSKELVDIIFDVSGVFYVATALTKSFIEYYNSGYSQRLRQAASYVASIFNSHSDDKLEQFIKQNMDRWGGEFTREAYVRDQINYD